MKVKKALLVLGGIAPSRALLCNQASDADIIIAVDKGADTLKENDILPTMLVGDMDSLNQSTLDWCIEAGVKTQRLPKEKDDTDGCYALDLILNMDDKPESLIILGALGGRFDHEFANMFLLVRALKAKVNAKIIDEQHEIMAISATTEVFGEVGATVSLLPLGKATVSHTDGLYYPLKDYELNESYPLGISNVFTKHIATVGIDKGLVLVIKIF